MTTTTRTITIPFKRGTTAQNDAYLGNPGEITIDSTLRTIRVHDGVKVGGERLLRLSDLTTDVLPAIETAKTYRDRAILAESNARASELAAAASRDAASRSEINAAASEGVAVDRAAFIQGKAELAGDKADVATQQAAIATQKATDATGQAGIATQKAADASASAAAALASQNTATTQAGIATQKAADAASSEANALASKNTATTQAGIATDKANLILGKIDTATNEANRAYNEANRSRDEADRSNARANDSSASAAAALASQNAAKGSEDVAAAKAAQLSAQLYAFNEMYIGQRANNPVVDGNGNPLKEGAIYQNTTDDKLYSFENGVWTPYDAESQQQLNNAMLSAQNAAGSEANALSYRNAAQAARDTAIDRATFSDQRAIFSDQRAIFSDQRATFADQRAIFADQRANDAKASADQAAATLASKLNNNGDTVYGTLKSRVNSVIEGREADGSFQGSIYWDASGFGVLHKAGNWAFRADAGGSNWINGDTNVTGTLHPDALLVTGNSYLGRTNPANNGRLEILAPAAQNAVVSQVSDNAYSLYQGFNSSGGLAFQVTGAAEMLIDGGVGKTRLSFASSSGSANYLYSTTTGFAAYAQMVYGASSHVFLVGNGTSQSEAARLTAGGDLGVGTTTPAGRLHVVGGKFRVDSGSTSWFAFGSSAVASSVGAFLKGGTQTQIGYIGSDGGGIVSTGSGDNFGLRAESDLILMSGAAERMRINAAGYVGIGTTNPGYKLDVVGATPTIRINNPQANGSYLLLQDNGWSSAIGTYSGNLLFYNASSDVERARFDAGGNLLVNKTGLQYPLDNQRRNFEINGATSVMIAGTINNAPAGYLYSDLNGTEVYGDKRLDLSTAGAARVRIDNLGGLTLLSNTASFSFAGGGALAQVNNYRTGDLELVNRVAGNGINFYVGAGAFAGKFDSSGKMGIGVTAPRAKLDIDGGANGTLILDHFYSYGATNWALKLDGQDNTSGGYLSQYVVNGGFHLAQGGWYYGGGPWRTDANSTSFSAVTGVNGTLLFHTNTGLSANTQFTPAERMRIENNGYVGIGTSVPASTLHVQGRTTLGTLGASGQFAVTLNPDTAGYSVYHLKTGVSGVDAFTITTGSDAYSSTERFRIEGAGNVGIGGPAKAKLYIYNGDFITESTASAVGSKIGAIGFRPYVGYAQPSQAGMESWVPAGSAGVDFADLRFFTCYGNPSNGAGMGVQERMRLSSDGNLLVGVTSGSAHTIAKSGAEGTVVLVAGGTAATSNAYFQSINSNTGNGAATGLYIGKNSTTSRSINAGGTVNASGADYAEYMAKAATCGDVQKGQIIGVDAHGKLTDKWADSVSFLVKSTDPSYVGGDIWGTEEAVGMKRPTDPEAPDYAEKMEEFEAKLEAARQMVDRVAFAGQVPTNVYGAKPGNYILPDNGGTAWDLMGDPDVPDWFKKYVRSVGVVQHILADGRANIRVKVA